VVDLLNTHEKVDVLIHNLIVIETWKDKIFPYVKDTVFSVDSFAFSSTTQRDNQVVHLSSLRSYIPLYNEASLLSLLQM